MINFILFAFCVGLWSFGFYCGKKFGSLEKMLEAWILKWNGWLGEKK